MCWHDSISTTQIPPELYGVVAEIIAWVYRLPPAPAAVRDRAAGHE